MSAPRGTRGQAPTRSARGGPSTRLHIDWTRCDGRGLCTELLPRVLTRDEWGYPMARDGRAEPELERTELADAREAVDLCPRLALSLLAES